MGDWEELRRAHEAYLRSIQEDASPHIAADSVGLYYPNQESMRGTALSVLGRVPSDAEFVALAAARSGDKVAVRRAKPPGRDYFVIEIRLRGCERVDGFFRSYKADTCLHNEGSGPYIVAGLMEVEEPGRRNGVGSKLSAAQAQAAYRIGVSRIITWALRRDDRKGYYTCARWGFDVELVDILRARLPRALQSAKRVSDLMRTQQGRRWWLKYGSENEMTFDASSDSESMQALRAYFGERGWDWGSTAFPTPQHIERLDTWGRQRR